MPRVVTPYDLLKVSRDAPVEVIRAAYRCLSQKYHPDHNPNDPAAARIMAALNTAYAVLSDPRKRNEIDEWIREEESQPAAQHPVPKDKPAPTSDSGVGESRPRIDFIAIGSKILRFWWVLVLIVIGGFMVYEAFKPPRSTGPPVYTPTVKATPAPATRQPELAVRAWPHDFAPNPPVPTLPPRPTYQRPVFAPNGHKWPSMSGYVSGYPRLHQDGLSIVAVDNTQNDSDVFVKLISVDQGKPIAVRMFFIRAREQFSVSNVRRGTYDIRYRDLDSGVISKADSFVLQEIPIAGGTRYSELRMTLYKVVDGNLHMEVIGEDEF